MFLLACFMTVFRMKLVCRVACFYFIDSIVAEWRCAELYRTFILQVIYIYIYIFFFFHDIYFCNVIVVLTDFVIGALQPSFQHVEDSRLKTLSQDLSEVLLKSKSANTAKKYERGFNSWRK